MMASVADFSRDPLDWLRKFSPEEWIRAALGELRRAQQAYVARDAKAGVAGCKRAAGMALNAVLIVEPNDAWGRSYVDHLTALGRETSAPEAVRAACAVLLQTHAPGHDILTLRTARTDERVLEAARDVMAHAYAVVGRHDAKG